MKQRHFLAFFLVATYLPASLSAGQLVSDKVTTNNYMVSGASLPQLRNEMNRKGPNNHWAYTKTNWRWDGRCNVRFTASVTLPKLTDRDALDSAELAEWDRMVAALTAHEMGHVDIGRSWAKAIKTANCNANAVDKLNAEWSAHESQYDRDTDHGRNEGVYLRQP